MIKVKMSEFQKLQNSVFGYLFDSERKSYAEYCVDEGSNKYIDNQDHIYAQGKLLNRYISKLIRSEYIGELEQKICELETNLENEKRRADEFCDLYYTERDGDKI